MLVISSCTTKKPQLAGSLYIVYRGIPVHVHILITWGYSLALQQVKRKSHIVTVSVTITAELYPHDRLFLKEEK